MRNFLIYYLSTLKYFVLLLCAIIIYSFVHIASAETMKSDSYQITFGNFNVTSGEKSSASYTLTDTVGQIAPGQFTGTGFLVKSGFQYIYPFQTFSFKISKLTVSFGDISYGSFATDSHSLIVDTDGSGGYLIQAYEAHPLRLQNDTAIIQDTTCDDGNCDESSATVWTDATNPGFGFNVSGDDVSADFSTSDHFRQFADLSNAEQPQTIMSASTLSTNRNATVTYKVAPAGNQQAGMYETIVVYQAIPTY